jgi:hypothetical protein
MVRHPDGEITWERSRRTRPAATTADYDRIVGRF